MSENTSRFSVTVVRARTRPVRPMPRPAFRLPCARVLMLALVLVSTILAPRPAVAQSEQEAALLEAARQRDVDAVTALLAAGVDVNAQDEEGFTALMGAAEEGALDVVTLLLDRGADVNMRTSGDWDPHWGGPPRNSGVTALMWAAAAGHLDVVALLLDRGADVNHVGNSGTALIFAAAVGHLDVVTLLLERGADPDAIGSPMGPYMAGTALMFAVLGGPDVVTLLLERGADVNARTGEHQEWEDAGLTALMFAAAAGTVDMVTLLLERGADVHAVSRQGRTALAYADLMRQREIAALLGPRTGPAFPLSQAVATGDVDQVRLLLDRGAGANARSEKGWPVLMAAAAEGHPDVAALLLDRGADVNTQENGVTALMMAVEGGNPEVVALLLDRGADVIDGRGPTALAYAEGMGQGEIAALLRPRTELLTGLKEAVEQGNVDQVAAALDRGADVNARLGWSPALMLAVMREHWDVVTLLLDRGADVNARDRDGGTALIHAVFSGQLDAVTFLLNRGADPDAIGSPVGPDMAGTALMWALQFDSDDKPAIFALLLERGADVNAQTDDGITALMRAATYGHPDVVAGLLDRGADVTAVDREGRTALEYAERSRHPEIAALLREAAGVADQ